MVLSASPPGSGELALEVLGEAVVARVDHHQAVLALRHRVAYVDQRLPVEVVGTSRV